jgi:hypothetical protein
MNSPINSRMPWHRRGDRAVPGGLGRREVAAFFLIGLVLDLLGEWRRIPHVLRGDLYDSDSYMRLVRIEGGLRLGHLGYLIPRDASGAGLVLHWSHLLDSLLLLAAAPLEPLLGWHRALFWAGAASGPVTVGLLAVAVGWAAAPLADQRFRWLAAVALALAPGIEGYGQLGVIHHHILLVVGAVMVAAFAFRAATGASAAGPAAGAWLAFALWLSPEAWPFGLLSFGALGIAWLAGAPGAARAARSLRDAGLTLALLLGAVLLVDPPPGPAVAFDHVSVVHLALAVALALLGAGLGSLDRAHLAAPGRAVLGAALAAVLLGSWIALFPRVILGPAGLTDAHGAALMLAGISEMRPATRPSIAVAFLLPGLFGVAAAGWLAWRGRSWLAGYGVLSALVVLALGFRYLRFAPYAEALGAAMLPLALSAVSRERVTPPLTQALCRIGLLAVLVLVPRIAPAVDPALQAKLAEVRAAPSCALRAVAARLAPYVGQVVLASPNLTPELLYRTPVRTVGSLYLRGVPAFLRLRAAWRSGPSATAPAAVRATGARLVLFCHRAGRSGLLAGAPRTTLDDRLVAGRVPPWLHPLWHDAASGYTLYRVGR